MRTGKSARIDEVAGNLPPTPALADCAIMLRTVCWSILLLVATFSLGGCRRSSLDSEGPLYAPPEFVGERKLSSGGEALIPLELQIHRDTLFVSYSRIPRIDAYSLELELLHSIELEEPEPVHPTWFCLTDDWLVVSDSEKRLIVLYDRTGKVVDSFGLLPDGKGKLDPGSLVIYGGVLYVSDQDLKRVLAVSLAEAAGITEIGELILTIPADGEKPLGLPGGLHVTDDGRVLIGDVGSGSIEVFTCDGRPIYSFESPKTTRPIGITAFAADDLADPKLAIAEEF